ncbi:MAG: Archaebacterial flagellin [Methanoregula sp. PtaU1.Bin051]|nr:MAG: Archaebacterial flagellin [Methanoregula sp. PtaU1.Bin051]
MSADTFVSALFIITAVVAAGILINAVYPIVWSTASTFSSSAHETDTRMRTDFKIVNTYGSSTTHLVKVWIKNIGSNPVGISEIQNGADVFIGSSGNFARAALGDPTTTNQKWTFQLDDQNSNNLWDTGETIEITARNDVLDAAGELAYFQFVLPNGVYRSVEFTIV